MLRIGVFLAILTTVSAFGGVTNPVTTTAPPPAGTWTMHSALLVSKSLYKVNNTIDWTTTEGSAKLRRTPHYVGVDLQYSGHQAYAAYNVLMMVVNAPSSCVNHPCLMSVAPLNVLTKTMKTIVGGAIADAAGKVHWTGMIPTAPMTGMSKCMSGCDLGIMDPYKAEIHFYLKSHSTVASTGAEAWGQLNTVAGSCPGGMEANCPVLGAVIF